ncbi:MAG TPA: DUF6328 family protein [Pseudomonadota bacterium]|nr:DUF6328 family protein [Pseudomonadota bacterium]
MPTPQSKGDSRREQQSLDREATHTLEESRMVLPGVQALFGFQLVAVYNAPFEKLLSPAEQQLHLLGLLTTAVAIALLMSPAAYQRQAEPHEISARFVRFSSVLLTLGMFVLMLSIQVDCYLIARIILKQWLPSLLVTIGLGLLFSCLWFVVPRLLRKRSQAS